MHDLTPFLRAIGALESSTTIGRESLLDESAEESETGVGDGDWQSGTAP